MTVETGNDDQEPASAVVIVCGVPNTPDTSDHWRNGHNTPCDLYERLVGEWCLNIDCGKKDIEALPAALGVQLQRRARTQQLINPPGKRR